MKYYLNIRFSFLGIVIFPAYIYKSDPQSLTFSVLKNKSIIFANSADPDDTYALIHPSYQDLHC